MKRRRVEPTEPPDLAGGLWDLVIPLGVGATIGAAAIVILRVAGLRFTWALFGAPVAYLAWVVNWQIGLACMTATLVASGAGLHWHQEDIKRGGEEAGRARAAKGPLHAARAWAAQRRLAEQGRVKPAERRRLGGEREARIALGIGRRGGVRHVPLGLGRGVHALVLGATGAGKTVTQAAIAPGLRPGGAPVRSSSTPRATATCATVVRDAARRPGRRLSRMDPRPAPPSTTPSPAAGRPRSPTRRSPATSWSEPHYELATQRLLGHVLTTMRAADLWPPTLSQSSATWTPSASTPSPREVGGDVAERVTSYVDGLSARGQAPTSAAGATASPSSPRESSARDSTPHSATASRSTSPHRSRAASVLYFHLDADRYPAASKLLARGAGDRPRRP